MVKTKNTESKKIANMADLLATYGNSVKNFRPGDLVSGKILIIKPKSIIVDIGGKSEGIVAEKAYNEARDFISKLKVGDKIDAFVIAPQNYDGQVILSMRNSAQGVVWDKLYESYENTKPVAVRVKQRVPSGLIVETEGITGFIPESLFGKEFTSKVDEKVGSTIEAIIVDIDKKETKLILSEKLVSEADEIKQLKNAISKVKEKEIYDGIVTTVTNFGVFVTIKVLQGKTSTPVDGLVHISELAWDKTDNPSDRFREGDKVKVIVIGKESSKKRGGITKLSLSIKQASADPWDKAIKEIKKDDKFKGKVIKLTDFGVFVSVKDGIEGLIHMTKIPPGKKLVKGDEVNVYVEDIDKKEKRLSLGLVLTAKPVGYR